MTPNKIISLASIITAALCCTGTIPAQAAIPDNEWFSLKESDRWLVRGRAVYVSPDEDSTVSIGGGVTASSRVIPELDISYFFSEHVAAELILGVTKHEMGAADTSLGNVDLGDVLLLPPTLTLQYHFTPRETLRPYVGAGLNYTVYFNEDPGQVSSIDYRNGFGYALQAGFDYALNEHWALNMDVKKIYMNTDVRINGGAVYADVDLDPWLFGVGFAYRF